MDTEPTTPTPDTETPVTAAPVALVPKVEDETTLSYRLKIVQQACGEVRKQVAEACGKNDQPGYYAADTWIVEAERALRKAATQCEEAEAAATVRGEV
jgi:hypothetical protein